MTKIFNFNFYLFKQLMRMKLTNILSTITNKLINFYIWAGCSMLVSGYLMQAFGLSKDYGAFQLGGILASVGLFELYGNAISFVADIEGDRTISYYLTLPGSVLTVLCSYICYYLFITVSMCLAVLPLAKLILLDRFVLANICWTKLIFFTLLINLVFATATILLSALVPAMDKFDILWIRFIFPLWFLGGFSFSWISIYQKIPVLSYIMLLNPITYTTDGIRNSLLGSNSCIPFWISCTVLIFLEILIGYFAYKALKKRLDFVG